MINIIKYSGIMLCLMSMMFISAVSTDAEQRHSTTIDISQTEFLNKLSKNKNIVVIDVRTVKEYDNGHVPGAINIPHNQILNNVDVLSPYANNAMVFYCHSGVRAKKVTDLLDGLHVTNLYHLKGDFRAWRGNNRPINKPYK